MALDLKITGGTIVDGTGAARYRADVGVREGRIVEIGSISTRSRRTLAAEGALVTPGFIDMHTHYDAQVLWDSELSPSTLNGVTTVVMGNCGVGCAPFKPEIRESISALLEGVEDIPKESLDAALDWRWQSFGSYLDKVEKRPHAPNLAANATHAPIRLFAMGERALDGSAPSEDDIALMQGLLKEALDSGACAFSSDRIDLHTLARGGHVPDWNAPSHEIMALTQTLAAYPGRPMQFASDFGGMVGTEAETRRELSLLQQVASAGIPVYTPLQQYYVQGGWRRLASAIGDMNANGARIFFEASARAIGNVLGLELVVHPFSRHPSYMDIESLPLERRIERMREPEFRARLLSEEPVVGPKDPPLLKRKFEMYKNKADCIFMAGVGTPDYEPPRSASIKAIAERDGKTVYQVYYEALTAGDGRDLLYFPSLNFTGGNLDEQLAILSLPNAIFSFSDAGAHVGQVSDASYSTFNLIHWGRDRGKGIPLERLVYQMSGAQAGLFGFKDRGRIEVGSMADLNVIDHQGLTMHPPEVLHDLPGGIRRLVQGATGYVATIANGVPIVERDQLTGELPGRVLRSRPN
jgi:N-acyl-D-aspartate/D-glutamate deacylase